MSLFLKQELVDLLKECKTMSSMDAPAYHHQSKNMIYLFETQNFDFYTWSDKFSNVRRFIECEILFRIYRDIWDDATLG